MCKNLDVAPHDCGFLALGCYLDYVKFVIGWILLHWILLWLYFDIYLWRAILRFLFDVLLMSPMWCISIAVFAMAIATSVVTMNLSFAA